MPTSVELCVKSRARVRRPTLASTQIYVRPLPVAHIPTVFVILYMCVTSDGSINLSCSRDDPTHERQSTRRSSLSPLRMRSTKKTFRAVTIDRPALCTLAAAPLTHRNLLLRHDAHRVSSTDTDGRDPDGFNRLERVLCEREGASAVRSHVRCIALSRRANASRSRKRARRVTHQLGRVDPQGRRR